MPTTRKRKGLVAELHHPSAHGVHSAPYSLGRDAGAALTAMYGRRQDHVTCAIEWYRGFCEGCGAAPDSAVEAQIAREALALKHGLDRAAIIIAGLDAMTADAEKVLSADRKAKP
jgi:hypothetical protein